MLIKSLSSKVFIGTNHIFYKYTKIWQVQLFKEHKDTIVPVPLNSHNLPTDWPGELMKSSKDGGSHVVQILKNVEESFGFFFVGDFTMRIDLQNFGWGSHPLAPT